MISSLILFALATPWEDISFQLPVIAHLECEIRDGDSIRRREYFFVEGVDVGSQTIPVITMSTYADSQVVVSFEKANAAPLSPLKAATVSSPHDSIRIAGEESVLLTPDRTWTNYTYLGSWKLNFTSIGSNGERSGGSIDRTTHGSCRVISKPEA